MVAFSSYVGRRPSVVDARVTLPVMFAWRWESLKGGDGDGAECRPRFELHLLRGKQPFIIAGG